MGSAVETAKGFDLELARENADQVCGAPSEKNRADGVRRAFRETSKDRT